MTKLQKVQYEAAFKTLRAVAAEMSDKQDEDPGYLQLDAWHGAVESALGTIDTLTDKAAAVYRDMPPME